MKIRIFSIMATLAIIMSVFGASGVVFATAEQDDGAAAYAEAGGDGNTVEVYYEGNGSADSTATTNGVGTIGEVSGGPGNNPSVTATATADNNDSFAYVSIGAWSDNEGWTFDEGGAWIDVSSSTGSIVVTGDATATGYDSTEAEVEIEFAYIYDGGEGEIIIDADATADGFHANAVVEDIGAEIYEDGKGAIYIDAAATAVGEGAEAIVEDITGIIVDGSTGIIHIDANATATGTSSYAEVGELRIAIVGDSEGEVTAVSSANANDGGGAYVETEAFIIDGSGNLNIWTIANADGEGSDAASYVHLEGPVPSGFFVDFDADGNAFALAILASNGTDVWALSFANATNGGGAQTEVWSGDGIGVDAEVGVHH